MKAISAIIAIALAVLSGVALHFRREQETGRQQIAVLMSKAQERQSETGVSSVPTAAQAPAQNSTVASQHSQQVESLDKPVPRGISPTSLFAQMQSPEGQARLRSATRQLLEISLPDLDKVVDLTTAERNELLDLLTTQQMRGMTTLAPEQESTQESEARQQSAYDTQVAALQTLLGRKYPKWQDYEETVTVRMEGRDLRTALDAAGVPLTLSQEQALIDALVAEQSRINQTVRTSRGVTISRTPENRQRLLSAASPHLSAHQLDEYQALLERRAAMRDALSPRPESRQ